MRRLLKYRGGPPPLFSCVFVPTKDHNALLKTIVRTQRAALARTCLEMSMDKWDSVKDSFLLAKLSDGNVWMECFCKLMPILLERGDSRMVSQSVLIAISETSEDSKRKVYSSILKSIWKSSKYENVPIQNSLEHMIDRIIDRSRQFTDSTDIQFITAIIASSKRDEDKVLLKTKLKVFSTPNFLGQWLIFFASQRQSVKDFVETCNNVALSKSYVRNFLPDIFMRCCDRNRDWESLLAYFEDFDGPTSLHALFFAFRGYHALHEYDKALEVFDLLYDRYLKYDESLSHYSSMQITVSALRIMVLKGKFERAREIFIQSNLLLSAKPHRLLCNELITALCRHNKAEEIIELGKTFKALDRKIELSRTTQKHLTLLSNRRIDISERILSSFS